MTLEPHPDLLPLPADGVVFAMREPRLRVVEGDHPLSRDHASEIAENWQREIAANPALFDGRLIFLTRVGLAGDDLDAQGHITPFSAFMWWRRQVPRPPGFHISAYAAIETSDGALVAIRMGAHTANPGQVYFAAGSFEPEDVVDGYCDVEANMRREVMEETGLDLSSATVNSGYHASRQGSVVTIFRLYRFDIDATDMVVRIEAHMRVAEDKEIAGAVVIRSADPSAQNYNISMLPVLDWYFRGHR
jgi:8-oxo-dGTP pyrophosphatase MutT (NUDIX family)